MAEDMDVSDENIPTLDECTELSRRQALRIAGKAGSALVALSALSSLGGCSSGAQSRVKHKGGLIGEPIPEDPIAHASTPSPVHTPPPYHPDRSSTRPLSAIPAFVIPRTKWTSTMPKSGMTDPMNRVYRITVHHDAIMPRPSGSYTDSLRRLQLIRTGHLNRGWADIGYHFAIDPKGRIFQARPLNFQGAHVKDNNPGNLGIVTFGNYELIRPTQATLNSINRMVSYAMERFNVPLSKVYTHQELRSTACPGRNLQKQMIATRAHGGTLALAAGRQTQRS